MLDYFKILAIKYNLFLDKVISIALNRYGIIIKDCNENRLRFNLNLLNNKKDNFYAVCVNTFKKSPFLLEDNSLYLDGIKIGYAHNITKDNCLATYFRNNKKAITFNSNSRSKCVGCKFCGTYSLKDDDNLDFSNKENIIAYFTKLLIENNISSMKKIESITICTGCFKDEDELIKHLLLVNNACKEMGFIGRINYIGSQLRDYAKIKKLANEIKNFGIYLTIEKFLDREKYMKKEKASLTLPKAKELLEYCSSIGITTTFLYILGLEDLKTIEYYFNYFKDSINKFPIVQVFQDYTPMQERYRCIEAKDIEYYLKARKIIANIFKDRNMELNSWECFRSIHFKDTKVVNNER